MYSRYIMRSHTSLLVYLTRNSLKAFVNRTCENDNPFDNKQHRSQFCVEYFVTSVECIERAFDRNECGKCKTDKRY